MVKRAVALAAIFALFVLVLPARGLTFLWDDWWFLQPPGFEKANETNEHWVPLFMAFFRLEHLAFGANHTFFLVTTWCIHVVNLLLLGTLLQKKTGDERAAAVAVLAFGVLLAWRE